MSFDVPAVSAGVSPQPWSHGAGVVVIGYDFWQKLFGGAPDVVGRRFRTDGDPVIVIGVMPRGFRGLRLDNAVDSSRSS